MKKIRKTTFWVGLATLTLFAAPAFAGHIIPANSVICPAAGPDVGRQLEADTNAGNIVCGASGLGNESEADFPGFTSIEKDEGDGGFDNNGGLLNITGSGGNEGTWSISAALWGLYDEIIIVFKFGGAEGQGTAADPDWISFLLTGGGTDGHWGWVDNPDSELTGLSHVTIYGRCSLGQGNCRPPDEVPEPGTLALFGLGLAGLGIGLRRRRRKS